MILYTNRSNIPPGSDALFTFPVNNTSSGTNSFVGHGGGVDGTPTALGNEALANYSFVGNGVTNQVTNQSAFSFIGDGCENRIGGTAAAALGAEYGFIGSGQNNCIDTGAAMSTLTPFGVIGGGQNNKICAGTCYSSIVGGQDNCVLHNWATVAGCGIASTKECAFHANFAIIPDMPGLGSGNPRELQIFPAPAILGLPLGTFLVVTN